jgi:hypothetical protein
LIEPITVEICVSQAVGAWSGAMTLEPPAI